MLHAGIGESHVNNLFSTLNVPGIHQKSLKRRERGAGKGLEALTKKSVSDALVLEISKTRERPNNLPQYINITSNHPPNIIKQLPASINRRISDNSCNEHEFNKAKPIYDDALKSSGYTEMLSFNKH